MRKRIPSALGVVLLLTFAGFTEAPADVTSELIVSGLNRPIYVTAPPGDGRLFIVEQRGQILIYESGALLTEPFLDIDSITHNISSLSEQGLLGLAFDPDFSNNRFFYVHYSANSGLTTIARYEVLGTDANKADHSSAQIIFTQFQPFANHNGGWIDFGPDGYLYVGLGDGGSGSDPGNRGQNGATLLGKMLRLDASTVPASIPASNPFVGNGNVLDEIWALGLRNPWRCSFDRLTGDFWIGDVGQNEFEEVDFQLASSAGGGELRLAKDGGFPLLHSIDQLRGRYARPACA